MGSIIKFAAVNTKVRMLEAKFLTKEQYLGLMRCRDYLEAIRYLKEETSYSQILASYKIEEIHRGKLEIILKRAYMSNFYKLRYYFTGNYRELFNMLFMRFEIEDLKIILRCKYAERSAAEIEELITAKGPLSTLNYDKLLSSKNLQDFVNNLYGTVYYKSLLSLLNTIKDNGLFKMEMMMDFIYFNSLRKCYNTIDANDSKILHEVMGTYSDLLNIQWIIRGRMHYKLTSEELFNYIIYDGHILNRYNLKKLCYAKDDEEFYKLIENTPYKGIFKRNNTVEYLSERNILVYLREMFEKYKRSYQMDISASLAYLELLYIELRDIISIVENKRYNISLEETLKYITVTI